MLLEPGKLSSRVNDELTRLDLYLRLLVNSTPVVYRIDLFGIRLNRAQMGKHFGLLYHLSVSDAEPQSERLLLI